MHWCALFSQFYQMVLLAWSNLCLISTKTIPSRLPKRPSTVMAGRPHEQCKGRWDRKGIVGQIGSSFRIQSHFLKSARNNANLAAWLTRRCMYTLFCTGKYACCMLHDRVFIIRISWFMCNPQIHIPLASVFKSLQMSWMIWSCHPIDWLDLCSNSDVLKLEDSFNPPASVVVTSEHRVGAWNCAA